MCEIQGIPQNVKPRFLDPRIDYRPFEAHVAESKWQYCRCQSCQEKRFTMERLPGIKINFDALRLPGERY